MHPMMILMLLAALFGTADTASAQTTGSTPDTLRLEKGAPRPAARVADLAWLAGRWVGEGMGGQAEEAWSDPAGHAMVGTSAWYGTASRCSTS